MHLDDIKPVVRSIFLIFIGALIGIFVFQNVISILEQKEVLILAKRFYELLIPDSLVEVESIKRDGEMYKVLVKVNTRNNINYIEAWISRDGKFLVENVVYLRESIDSMKRNRDFIECLFSRGVRIFGVLDAQTHPNATVLTLQQLNLLGRYSRKLFVSCDGEGVQLCLDRGITQVPAILHNDKIYFGLRDVYWFSELTGCKI